MRALLLIAASSFAILAGHWKRLALVDPITRSGNSLALARFFRLKGREAFTGSLFLLDIDGFAKVNSNLSYAAGDGILSAVVTRLAICLGKSAKIFRYKYGDEFLAIVEGGTLFRGDKAKQRFLTDLQRNAFFLPGIDHSINISVSIGHLFIDRGYLSDSS